MDPSKAEAQPSPGGEALGHLLSIIGSAEALLPREQSAHVEQLVVRTAARVVSARAASLQLIDETGKELVFQTAVGPKAEELHKFRVPLGHGIAGLVAVTGQPMAISAAEQDPRFAVEIAQSIGYVPHSILCVPLRVGDSIIGVLEMLDKEGRDTFTAEDLEVAGYFAELAAEVVQEVERRGDLRTVLVDVVNAWLSDGRGGSDSESLLAELDHAIETTQAAPDYKAAVEIASLIGDIARAGDAERALCYDVLKRMHQYIRSRTGRPWSL